MKGKPEGMGPLGRPMHRWDDVKRGLKQMEWKAQARFTWPVAHRNGNEPPVI
jgi:hypothetical protein